MNNSQAIAVIMASTWDQVTPELRGIAFRMNETSLNVRFLYAEPPSEWIIEEVSYAETECIADVWQTHQVSYVAEFAPPDQPRILGEGERWVYLRHEPPVGA